MSHPGYPGHPGPPYGAPRRDPGQTLGIVGLVLSVVGCTGPIGLIVSLIALSKSRKAGFTNAFAIIGIVIGVIFTVIGLVWAVAMGFVYQKCQELGPGVHQVGAATYTCDLPG